MAISGGGLAHDAHGVVFFDTDGDGDRDPDEPSQPIATDASGTSPQL